MKPLLREGDAEFWDDTKIEAGADWRLEIEAALASAKVAVLLVSADFLASDFIANDELPKLLKAAEEDGATVIPLILSASRFARTPALARFQAINPPTRPLVQLGRGQQEKILEDLAEAIEHALATGEASSAKIGAAGESEPSSPESSKAEPTPLEGGVNVNAPQRLVPIFATDDFRNVADGFDSKSLRVRASTALKVKEIAAFVTLDDVLGFSHSLKTAERVAAAIALGVHIRSSTEARADIRVRSSLGELLGDRSSLVRYRAAEVIRSSPSLVAIYRDDLEQLARTDKNDYVRNMAANALPE
jgi:hypothetical protein